MISYKYSFEDICDRPLLTVSKGHAKQGWITTLFFLPVLMLIATVLVMFWPIKMVQLLAEKLSD